MGPVRKIGILGFGNLGRYLVDQVVKNEDLELVFVWNRSPDVLKDRIPGNLILSDILGIVNIDVDMVIEVAHPSITQQYGELILQHADYMIGSPTCLADTELERRLHVTSISSGHVIYVPRGALWGSEDIRAMADLATLQSLRVTMTKHPDSLKVLGDLVPLKDQARADKARTVLYDGPVRQLCPVAPNNVNFMAAASIAASNLGLDGTQGCLIADVSCRDVHVMEIEVTGVNGFSVTTRRVNPAKLGAVTGQATFPSFLTSITKAHGKQPGYQLC